METVTSEDVTILIYNNWYVQILGNPFEIRLLNLRINFFLLRSFVSFFCCFFSLRFGQISPLVFFRWLTVTSDRNVTVSPVITAFHSCCLSHHVFDQVNLWPALVGIETTIFWQCSPGTVESQRLYPPAHRPRRAIKVGFFCLMNPIIWFPYLVFHSRVRVV